MMHIPKIIHYIWLGGKPMPPSVEDTVRSWKDALPGYEIVPWTEENYDIFRHPWMERMHKEGKYAFASDWARLHILQKHGGIYLDTDVEIHRSFDPFLEDPMFWGFEYDCYLATCVIGSSPGHPLLGRLLSEYDGRTDAPINNSVVTSYFLRSYPEFRLNNTEQTLEEGVHILPKEYFSVPTRIPAAGYCRHHGSNLWREGGKGKSPVKNLARRWMGEANYYKLVSWNVCRKNEFYPVMRAHRRMGKSSTGNPGSSSP